MRITVLDIVQQSSIRNTYVSIAYDSIHVTGYYDAEPDIDLDDISCELDRYGQLLDDIKLSYSFD